MKFKGSLTALQLDLEDYRRRLHEHMTGVITRAAFDWLNTVLNEIPTWSGASRATFLALSREVGFSLSISPSSSGSKGLGIGVGASHGQGEMTADSKKGEYTFSYSTSLPHLIWNEFNTPEGDPNVFKGLKKPGPYHFQIKGQEAFQKIVAEVELPNPWKSLKSKKVKVG